MTDFQRMTMMLQVATVEYSEHPGEEGTSAIRLEHDNDAATWFFFNADGMLDSVDCMDMNHVGQDEYTEKGDYESQ